MNPAIKEALGKVIQEETRLKTELEKVQAVRRALEGQPAASPTPRRALAPAGALQGKILEVLDRKHPKSRGEIIAAIKQQKYAYSLTPLHVTKHLIRLLNAKKVRRIGSGIESGYVRKV